MPMATPSATAASTKVSIRLPNSIAGWNQVSGWNSGVKRPGSHWGHEEQPKPEPLRRTTPPVTIMPACVTMLAMVNPRVWRVIQSSTPIRARRREVIRRVNTRPS
ncbi:hypothetical protein GCM10025876_35630 [Demequina litorisediminis]|uniref:Uncharacterized protein n=1 Tax=Demequina litorisediminis TaxID=1849022 RepID=A0ABQ6IHK5_9MICO|nr:hypothetical protein GCM10025876_35630 [Demequina litorisediminis]